VSGGEAQKLPVWCTELELGGRLPLELVPSIEGAAARTARVLLRLHGEPLGTVEVGLSETRLSVATVLAEATPDMRERATAHLVEEGVPGGCTALDALPPPTDDCPLHCHDGELVTVAVCTRDRPEVLRRCLARLEGLTYRRLDVLVVDNAPGDERTRRVVDEFRVRMPHLRYVREDRPGLSCARNRAVAEARGTVLAFTDDDVSVDAAWVEGLLRGFRRRPDVGCVTGLVCTASITTVAEAYFDARVSWATLSPARTYHTSMSDLPDPLFPYRPGIFGTGANLALRTDVIRSLGGFDEALGAGTPTRGGEDLDVFLRVLLRGFALAVEPSALVWHHHRADIEDLRSQLFGYGTGLAAYVCKLLADPLTRGDVLARVWPGLRVLGNLRRTTTRSDPNAVKLPRGLWTRELYGMAAGPLLYRRALRGVPREHRSVMGSSSAAPGTEHPADAGRTGGAGA
jgi:GT2 family glycosyltransferase